MYNATCLSKLAAAAGAPGQQGGWIVHFIICFLELGISMKIAYGEGGEGGGQ